MKIHFNVGRKHSDETKRKIGLKTIERASITKEQRRKSMLGKNAGDKNPSKRPEVREKIRLSKIGKKRPDITGEKNNNWHGGVTKINDKIRKSTEYSLWRESVFKRDNYTCVWCGKKGFLEADHIKPFALYPELRFAIDNGRTLCKSCHKTTDTYLNRWFKRYE